MACLITGSANPELMQKPLSEGGSSVYLRLSTRPLEQPDRTMTSELQQGIINVRGDMSRGRNSTGVNCCTPRAFVCTRLSGRLLDGATDRGNTCGGRVLRRGGSRRFASAARAC